MYPRKRRLPAFETFRSFHSLNSLSTIAGWEATNDRFKFCIIFVRNASVKAMWIISVGNRKNTMNEFCRRHAAFSKYNLHKSGWFKHGYIYCQCSLTLGTLVFKIFSRVFQDFYPNTCHANRNFLVDRFETSILIVTDGFHSNREWRGWSLIKISHLKKWRDWWRDNFQTSF